MLKVETTCLRGEANANTGGNHRRHPHTRVPTVELSDVREVGTELVAHLSQGKHHSNRSEDNGPGLIWMESHLARQISSAGDEPLDSNKHCSNSGVQEEERTNNSEDGLLMR